MGVLGRLCCAMAGWLAVLAGVLLPPVLGEPV